MKAECEIAMKLMEKDVHEKQDTIISLRLNFCQDNIFVGQLFLILFLFLILETITEKKI